MPHIEQHSRAEALWEELGGNLCVCQRVDVPHWCEGCQRRIQLIREAFSRAASSGGTAHERPILTIEVEREDDGRCCASWETGDGKEAGCAEYSPTIVGALANLCATLIKVDEDKSHESRSPDGDGRSQSAGMASGEAECLPYEAQATNAGRPVGSSRAEIKHATAGSEPADSLTLTERTERPKPQAKRLRERCQMNIFTVTEPYPDVTKTIVRQLLSALESAERYIQSAASGGIASSPKPDKEETAWLVALGSMPPQWWTGRGDEWTADVDGTREHLARCAIRFARREDAERAIGWLLDKNLARGCKAEEHIWLPAAPVRPVQEKQ